MAKRILTRKLAIANGDTTYVGSVCQKHAEHKGIRNTNDGSCVPCGLLKAAKWRATNPDKFKASQNKWYNANRQEQVERCRKFRDDNPELMKQLQAEYGRNNRAKINAKTTRRKAIKLRATPTWANPFYIEEAYHLAKLREKTLGGRWHVDHIVPLKSKLVCGLHTEINLQVIPANSNLIKSNSFWPQMPT